MKRYLMVFTAILLTGIAFAQDPVSAQKGVTYGAGTNGEGELVSADLLPSRIQKEKYVGKITGKVVEVCQEKGWGSPQVWCEKTVLFIQLISMLSTKEEAITYLSKP